MSGAQLVSVLVLIGGIVGLCWMARQVVAISAVRLAERRADGDKRRLWREHSMLLNQVLGEMLVRMGKVRSDFVEVESQQVINDFFSAVPKQLPAIDPVMTCDGTIQTSKGHYFDLLAPERSEFDVEVIAAALSKICRFTGHCSRFYSVAQHAVLVSYAVPEQDAYEALHHDDEEAFLNDIAKPLKELLPDYQRLEKRVRPAICTKLGLAPQLPASVKHADRVLLATEQRELMPPEWQEVEWDVGGVPTRWIQATERHPWWTLKGVTPLEGPIHCWTPEQAEREYLKRHYELLALRVVHAQKARAA